MRPITFLTATLVLYLGCASAGAAQDAHPTRPDIDDVVAPYVGRDAPGVGVLVMENGELIHLAGYGVADLETGREVDANTVFDLASVSKQMTALAAMLLIEDGTMAQDARVADLLPAFGEQPGEERAITVADLVHHLAGLPDYLNADDYPYQPATSTNDEVIEWAAAAPLERAPGIAFDYSNTGYLTLGSLVAAAAGADSLAEVLSARVWSVLDMEHTGLVAPGGSVDAASLAKGYKGTGGAFEPSTKPTVTEGDGNVLTTLSDLARYEQVFGGDTLLDAAAVERLFQNGTFDEGSPLVTDEGSETGYGFGWYLETVEGDRYASHSGSWMGTSTYYQRNLTTGLTIVVLANGEDMDCASLVREIEAVVEAP